MGKQVRFYMLDDDEKAFLQHLLADRDAVLAYWQKREGRLQLLDDPIGALPSHSRQAQFVIWYQGFPVDERYVRESRLRRYDEDFGTYVETSEVRYHFDMGSAPVIEYSPSGIHSSGTLLQGRIWASMESLIYTLDGRPELIYKGAAFEERYDAAAKWLRGHLRRVKGVDGWFGRQALAWYQDGGKLHDPNEASRQQLAEMWAQAISQPIDETPEHRDL